MEKEKKNKSGLIITILVSLIFLIIGFFGGKFLGNNLDNTSSKKTSSNKDSIEKEQIKEENLDINSRLVKNLYSKVAPSLVDQKSCFFGWNYPKTNGNIDDFYADKADSAVKMNIVYGNLSEAKRQYVECNESVPDTKDDFKSICYGNKLYNQHESERAFSRDYVESVYKGIFGKDAVLDTSAYFATSAVSVERYYYVSTLDKYVLYQLEGGGTCGGGYSTEVLTKATKNNKEVKIFVKQTDVKYNADANGRVTEDEANKVETDTTVVYTFELEDDGMYKFVSRVKETN